MGTPEIFNNCTLKYARGRPEVRPLLPSNQWVIHFTKLHIILITFLGQLMIPIILDTFCFFLERDSIMRFVHKKLIGKCIQEQHA